MTLRASFASYPPEATAGFRVAVRMPWRFPPPEALPLTGRQMHLPGWIPQERTVWTGSAMWVMRLPEPLAPVPALR